MKEQKSSTSKFLKKKIHAHNLNGIQHGFWEHSNSTIGGALVKDDLKPSKEGILVYINRGKDLSFMLKRVEQAGGKVLL